MLKAKGQYKDAIGIYFCIPSDPSLYIVVMLEQAPECDLSLKLHLICKYGFHLVLVVNSY